MPLLTFLLEAVLISFSGVMTPGPLSATTVARGSDSSHAGALVAIGHGIVELPLMVGIFYGLGYLLERSYVGVGVAFVGGVLLLVMGIGMLRSVRHAEVSSSKDARSPVMAGMVLSAGNPYFLLWWATVGATLVSRSARFGLLGFLLLALFHWLCDFVWLYLLSGLSFKAKGFLGRRFQMAVFAVSGVLLIFFGARFIVGAIGQLIGQGSLVGACARRDRASVADIWPRPGDGADGVRERFLVARLTAQSDRGAHLCGGSGLSQPPGDTHTCTTDR